MSIRDTFKARLTAMAKPADINESVEQIDEVSDAMLTRYSGKAREQLKGIASKRGPKSKVDKKVIAKRDAGVTKSNDIRSERRAKEYDAHARKSHAAWKSAVHDKLAEHGYTAVHPGAASTVYTKHDPETNSLFVAKHHFGHPSTRDSTTNHEGSLKLVSSNGTTSDVRHNSWLGRPKEADVDLHAHHSKNIGDELERHHSWSKDRAFNQHMNEEVEPVSEAELIEAFGEDPEADPLIEAAVEEITAEVAPENLAEGRGRPRKDGTSAVGADREHIMMQLRKHISLRGANPIEFADGSKHKITEGHARLAQLVHSQLRTSIEKGNFEKKLDHSHESFVNALKNKETAGEGKKAHGITLPARDRVARLKFASGE